MRGGRHAAGWVVAGLLTVAASLYVGIGVAGAEGTGEVTAIQAQESLQQVDPAILAPSLAASLEGQSVQPAITDAGEELASAGTLAGSTISKDTPGGFAVNTTDGELSFTPVGTSASASVPTIVNGAAALSANAWPYTDAVIRPGALGATTVLQVRSAEAPRSFSWEVGLGPDQQLQQLSDSSIAVVDAAAGTSSTESGAAGEGGPVTPAPLDASLPGFEEQLGVEPGEEALSEEAPEPEASLSSSESEDTQDAAPLPSLPAAPTSTTPAGEAPSGEPQPQNTQAQYTAASSAVATAEQQTGNSALMVLSPPTVTDAHGNSVPAALSVSEDTITLTIQPQASTSYPLIALASVAAPSNQASAARAHRLRFGFSDPHPATFEPFDGNLKGGPLHVRTARLILPYNTSPTDPELIQWLQAVGAEGLQPFLTLQSNCEHEPTCTSPGIETYRKAVKALIKARMNATPASGSTPAIPAVKLWGAWNEPDGRSDPLHGNAPKAAHFWQIARSVVSHVGCSHCTVVAGEFTEYHKGYMEKYINTILHHRYWPGDPHVWGMHDYHDLVNVKLPLSGYTNKDAVAFTNITSTRLHHPELWISEAGVELQSGEAATRLEGHEKLQRGAALDFLRRLGQTSSRIGRAYYYLYKAPPAKPTFDSALVSFEGGKRPAYCVLAFSSHSCPTAPPTVLTGEPFHAEGGQPVTLRGEVNPNASATTYYFKYGPTTSYGHTTTPESAGSGTSQIPVTTQIASEGHCPEQGGPLETHFRLVATNAAGTVEGGDSHVEYVCQTA